MRNQLTALRRKIKTIRHTDPNTTYYLNLNEKYKILTAKYKRKILDTRTLAWRRFCSGGTNSYGTCQKFFTGKFFSPDELGLETNPTTSSKQQNLEFLTKTLFGPSNNTNPNNQEILFTAPNDSRFTAAEIKNALWSFDIKKAPGPDCIDFQMLRMTYKILPKLFTNWANKCLHLNYFPLSLRNGEVVYFLKKDKDPTNPESYRPICLLPTLGKLLEKLLVSRLTFFLESKGLLHENQFGFREGLSCEKALHEITNSCKQHISDNLYTVLVSFDIRRAFDCVEWKDILIQLKNLNCPANLAGVIASYLSNRSVIINWGSGLSTHKIEKGCPQGSCLGPILWLLIANFILLELLKLGFTFYAFADDFSFILTGRRRLDLEILAARVFPIFCNILSTLNLHLSTSKTQALTFAKPKKLLRKPVIHVNGKSVKHVTSLKLLGITLDENFSFTPHLTYIKNKVFALHQNSLKLTSKYWGASNSLLRCWYLTIIERIILYGAGIWGGGLTKQNRAKLASIQRPFLLQMSRGYRTISTDALNIITGIPPIALSLDYEFLKTNILQLHNETITTDNFPNDSIQLNVPTWSIHPAKDFTPTRININKNSYSPQITTCIFTDGSHTEDGVASAFCVLKSNQLYHSWSGRLGDHNSIFQAELFAIQKALEWAVLNTVENHFHLFTDSLSSLQALSNQKTKHPLILTIKKLIIQLNRKISLGHVSAHKGIEGNELADTLAREATSRPEVQFSLPIPHSFVKSILKKSRNSSWETLWAASNKGRHTFSLIPHINPFQLHFLFTFLNPAITAFLTGHGPFATYLHYFKRRRDDLCPCGQVGSPGHYFYFCPLTKLWHIKPLPVGSFSSAWVQDVISRPLLVRKLKLIFGFLMDLSNLLN